MIQRRFRRRLLHHVLTQTGAYMKDVTGIAKDKSKKWQPRPSALL